MKATRSHVDNKSLLKGKITEEITENRRSLIAQQTQRAKSVYFATVPPNFQILNKNNIRTGYNNNLSKGNKVKAVLTCVKGNPHDSPKNNVAKENIPSFRSISNNPTFLLQDAGVCRGK